MNDRLSVLLVSNGHGEAAIAGYLARAIASRVPGVLIEHFPLVGRSQPGDWPAGVGPQADMPSGGLVANWNVRNLAGDVRAGLVQLVYRQRRFLRTQHGRTVLVAVGDAFCLWMALAAGRPVIFVATAKSDYVAPHSALERKILARSKLIFARDAATAQSLARRGLPAVYAGNLMMDGIAPTGTDLGAAADAVRLAVLPGSRADAPTVAAEMLERVSAIARLLHARGRRVQAFVSVAPGVSPDAVVRALRALGAQLPPPLDGHGVVSRFATDSLELVIVWGCFGDVLAAAQLALGQAGTANEQAAGFGLPVVAALEPGETPAKMQWYRMRQKRLLGEALLVLPPKPELFAKEVVDLLDDPGRQAAMAQAGKQRMGKPGGAAAVADALAAMGSHAERAREYGGA
jgi:uncharacterized protein (TIGR03492 family)